MTQVVAVAQAFSASTQEAGGFLWVWGQPGLQSEFQDKPELLHRETLSRQNRNNNHQDDWNEGITLQAEGVTPCFA